MSQQESQRPSLLEPRSEAEALINERIVIGKEMLDINLHEQPDKGRTVIEKIEDHTNVGFAVVLMTPDDIGGPSDKPHDELNARARQNVIFELGLFFGKLTRSHVCALHKENVELPADIAGLLYIPMDEAGAWRMRLARELKAAGLPVDMNKAV